MADATEMNTLVKNMFIVGSTNGTDEHVEAIGTAESIMAFGYNRHLDLDQQVAFEILASTVVLTFVEEAIARAEADGNTDEIEELHTTRNKLRELAQIEQREGKPLRMFLTGPAGAGKCKYCELHRMMYVPKA